MQRLKLGMVVMTMVMMCLPGLTHAQAPTGVTVIEPNKVNADQVAKGAQLIDRLYQRWQNDEFEKVGDEFSAEMQRGLTPELQKQTYEQTVPQFGAFQKVTFVSALSGGSLAPGGFIYRYRAKYSKAAEEPEIRLVFDHLGKISGMWLKPWNDELR